MKWEFVIPVSVNRRFKRRSSRVNAKGNLKLRLIIAFKVL